MKPQQAIKGYKLTANTEYDIMETFKRPIVVIQNQGLAPVDIIINGGEPLVMTQTPFAWEPLVPIVGTIQTASSDIVVFA